VLQSTFQLADGVGPSREQRLWAAGITSWGDFPEAPAVALTPRIDGVLRAAIERACDAHASRDAEALAALLPAREHWRLLPLLGDDAVYLDIETGDDVFGREGISAIGLCDERGPRLLLAGRDLDTFPDVARGHAMMVTFNGLSFDLPILRRAFPDWRPPACQLDLRHVLARLGWEGGLKAIERSVGLKRPDHLDGVGGWDASRLWRHGCRGDRTALRLFAEYNLYDVINLRTLAALAYNALVGEVATPAVRAAAPPLPVPGRGDVLYDVSKILLAL